MQRRSIAILACTALLTGCAIPGLPSFGPGGGTFAAKSTEDLQQLKSMPFATVLFDGTGGGRYFQAGETEKLVLETQADLDAFLSRHPRKVPEPVKGPLMPMPSPPPGGTIPPPAEPQMEPLPETLTSLDFSQHRAVAFFDGSVKLGATSRILAVEEQPERLVVHTMRWEPPLNPASADDKQGRVHIIKLPRTDKPVVFAETAINNEVAGPMEGGSEVAGNPRMNPKWKAVPNPEVTREMVEQHARGHSRLGPGGNLTVEKRTLRWIHENLGFDQVLRGARYTPDSEVWLAIAEGDIGWSGPGPARPGQVGGTPPKASKITMLLSIEDGMMFQMMAKQTPGEPGFRFHPKPGPYYVGDAFTFDVQGTPVEGTLTLKLVAEATGKEWVQQVAYHDVGAFKLVLDPAHLPGLVDVPVQKIAVSIEYGNAKMGQEIHLIRDRDALDAPPLRATGPGGLPHKFGPAPSAEEMEAFALDIATKDWQGKNLSITGQVVTRADLTAPNFAERIPSEVPLRRYEIRGKFPKFLVPEIASETGELMVLTPQRLVVVLSESTPMHVVMTRANAQ